MIERIKVFTYCVFTLFIFSIIMNYLNQSNNPSVTTSKQLEKSNFIIVIDAGHGGSDGGAVGIDGTNESVLNLQIAQKLNDLLTLEGFNTVMTRNDENSIGESGSSIRNEKVSDIHKRMDIMNGNENCIFISVHQNFYQGSSSWGTQVFYSGNNEESFHIASSIQSSVVSLLQNDNKRAVKKSDSSIYLLYKAKKPAVLVECGFISNQTDLFKLKNEQYQKQLSLCIADGIINYLNEKGALYGF